MRKLGLILALLMVVSLAGACSAAPLIEAPQSADYGENTSSAPMPAPAAPAPAYDDMVRQELVAYEPEMDKEKAGWGTGYAADSPESANSNNDYGGHKIIKNANLGIETREFDLHVEHIKQKVVDMGGYVSSSHTSGRKPDKYGDPGRYANITCRIPQQSMEAFINDTRGLATVTYESSSGEDITSSYFDTESRLSIYESQRKTITGLLDRAETMEDIIKLESELSRLTYEIENLTTQLRRWDNLVDFATVSIDVSEIALVTAVSSDDSIGTRINEGLSRTLSGMAVFFENLFVFLVVSFPVLLLLAVIAIVIILLFRRHKKKQAENPKPVKERKKFAPGKYKYGSQDEQAE